jgi:hypothetical protein
VACNCKHNEQEIRQGMGLIAEFRDLFIKRMTVDSDHNNRRRRDYNQAIFHYKSDEDVDMWNEYAEQHGFHKEEYGQTYAVWSSMDMEMVLQCFDDALKDWRRSWCDVDGCRRK